MCFNIRNNKDAATLWIAKEDIVCYKILGHDMVSPYQGFKYELKSLYKVKIKQPRSTDEKGNLMFKLHPRFNQIAVIDVINRGLHSYTSLEKAKRKVRDSFTDEYIIVRCVIPKGSEFYHDPYDEEYVSNQLIAKRVLKNSEKTVWPWPN